MTGRALCIKGLGIGDTDEVNRDVELLRSPAGDLGMVHTFMAAVIVIAADGKIIDQAGKRLQPLQGSGICCRPVRIADDANLESKLFGPANASTHRLVIEKRFTALEVDPPDTAQLAGLGENVFDVFKRHRARLRRPAPHKAMVALVVALIGQQQVQPGQRF